MDLSGACGFDAVSSICVPVQIPMPTPMNNCGYVPPIQPACGMPKCTAATSTSTSADKQAALASLLNNNSNTVPMSQRTWPTVVLWVLLAVLLAGAVGFLIWWFARTRKSTQPQPSNPTPTNVQPSTPVPAAQPPGTALAALPPANTNNNAINSAANRAPNTTAALLGGQRANGAGINTNNPAINTNINNNNTLNGVANRSQAPPQQPPVTNGMAGGNNNNCNCNDPADYFIQQQQQQQQQQQRQNQNNQQCSNQGFQTAFAPGWMPHNLIGGGNGGFVVGMTDKASLYPLSSASAPTAVVISPPSSSILSRLAAHEDATLRPRIPMENESRWEGANNASFCPISDALPGQPRNRYDMKPFNIRDYIAGQPRQRPSNTNALMQGMGIDESLFFPSDIVHPSQYQQISVGDVSTCTREDVRWSSIPDFTIA